MKNTLPTVRYAIDKHDRLLDVNEEWGEFANSNEAGTTLHPDSVIGKPLWNYIRDPSLQSIYRRLLCLVRDSGKPVEFPFRCDSPLFRRYMCMTILTREDGNVLFISQTQRVVKRTEQEIRLTRAFQGFQPIRQCSMCNLFKIRDGEWAEADVLVLESKVLAADQPATVIWGICEHCRDKMAAL
ncbi:hypothetical protein [Rhodopirellula sp. MGV]|uniref:hypothetical protein n=1 Tax=Rhodopirellula sp. MGV TaxID=2023130 RepID=UPI000B97296E|nr:hypothetical protein [Rhodopirellula sp. MGV]OYP35174.1 hypothetical protein CGZ80_12300 [Rhodopirellula sp. MGV]PNY37812.1 hypothetical protein C2E31_06000 [Rhodopirellula baltica]